MWFWLGAIFRQLNERQENAATYMGLVNSKSLCDHYNKPIRSIRLELLLILGLCDHRDVLAICYFSVCTALHQFSPPPPTIVLLNECMRSKSKLMKTKINFSFIWVHFSNSRVTFFCKWDKQPFRIRKSLLNVRYEMWIDYPRSHQLYDA